MMNSRVRRMPPRGRGSSRSFVCWWYQICGSSRYERISRAACQVTHSSWVIASAYGFPDESSSLKRTSMSYRSVARQSSAGWSTGISISRPIVSISSRMIPIVFWSTRHPSGR